VSVSYWPKGAGDFGHIGIGVDTDDTQGYLTADPKVPWSKRLFGAPEGGTEDDIAAHTKTVKLRRTGIFTSRSQPIRLPLCRQLWKRRETIQGITTCS
jgi:hypothetical protein